MRIMRTDFLPGAHRPRRPQTPGHKLPVVRHGIKGVSTKPIKLISGAHLSVRPSSTTSKYQRRNWLVSLTKGGLLPSACCPSARPSLRWENVTGATRKHYMTWRNATWANPTVGLPTPSCATESRNTRCRRTRPLTTRRAAAEAKAGMADGAASSMFDYGTELNKPNTI